MQFECIIPRKEAKRLRLKTYFTGKNCCHGHRNGYQVDHIVSLAKGGSNASNNIQLLCKKKVGACNQRKSAKDPIDFAQSIGLML